MIKQVTIKTLTNVDVISNVLIKNLNEYQKFNSDRKSISNAIEDLRLITDIYTYHATSAPTKLIDIVSNDLLKASRIHNEFKQSPKLSKKIAHYTSHAVNLINLAFQNNKKD